MMKLPSFGEIFSEVFSLSSSVMARLSKTLIGLVRNALQMFDSVVSQAGRNSIPTTHIHTHTSSPSQLTLDLLLHRLFLKQQRSSHWTVSIIDTQNKITDHFWMKHIIIPLG